MSDFADLLARVACHLLGPPNENLSTKDELRWGSKGSLSVHLGKGTFFNFETSEGGGTLDFIRWQTGLSHQEAFAWMRSEGIDPEDARYTTPLTHDTAGKRVATAQLALNIWHKALPAQGSLVEAYLRSRGITVPVPPCLRYAPKLKHKSGTCWPAMVALVTRGTDAVPMAIHRTFLRTDGSGKAPVDTQKMALGPCRGGAVRLAQAGDLLMVGEGIETCLATTQAVVDLPVWAALSTSGLRTLDLPAGIRRVIIVADGDDAGERAAREAGTRWKREGRSVRIARPPRGKDFADLLRE